MTAQASNRLPVLIVGAGPVGLTMALSLTLRGVKCRIIDMAPQPTDKSKALALHSRTLEYVENMGIVDDFLKVGFKVHASTINNGNKVLVHLSFDEMEGYFPFALMIPQCDTERILTENLAKHSVKVERPLELISFVQDAYKVTATIKNADGEEKVEANWLLGCDGAHSTTRHELKLPFEGDTYEESFATADVHVHWDRDEGELQGFVDADGMAFFFPLGNKRYRVLADGPLHKSGDPLALEEIQAIINKRVRGEVKLSDPVWLTWFALNRRSVKQYRSGRIFVSGDAAHIHSPALGQGMNTGMQDALNLAWKIDLVEKGVAKPELLDSYQQERHPVGQTLLRNTDFVTKVITLRNPIEQAVRNRLMPILANHEVVKQRAWKTLSMLAVNYRTSKLVGEHREKLRSAASHPLTELGGWFDFGHGPTPGDRAADGELLDASTKAETRVYKECQNTKHNLFLFQGLQDAAQSLSAINGAIAEIKANYGDFIQTHVVLSQEKDASQVKSADSVLVDSDATIHRKYGAAHSCLYLIRPDLFVGFRSEPINAQQLRSHLDKVFSAQPVAVK